MKFVITGGPGAGKTSVMIALERLCARKEKNCAFVRECAEDLIKFYKKKGIENPTKMLEFQYEIIDLQKQRETAINNAYTTFLDRSFIDTLAYNTDSGLAERIMREAKLADYEPLVLFMEHVPKFYEITKVREETFEEAVQIGERIKKAYTDLGYVLAAIEADDDLDKRAERILHITTDYRNRKPLKTL